jgi:hypothetical protein
VSLLVVLIISSFLISQVIFAQEISSTDTAGTSNLEVPSQSDDKKDLDQNNESITSNVYADINKDLVSETNEETIPENKE